MGIIITCNPYGTPYYFCIAHLVLRQDFFLDLECVFWLLLFHKILIEFIIHITFLEKKNVDMEGGAEEVRQNVHK